MRTTKKFNDDCCIINTRIVFCIRCIYCIVCIENSWTSPLIQKLKSSWFTLAKSGNKAVQERTKRSYQLPSPPPHHCHSLITFMVWNLLTPRNLYLLYIQGVPNKICSRGTIRTIFTFKVSFKSHIFWLFHDANLFLLGLILLENG